MDLTTGAFWIALLKIIWVDILLSGDNAVVIALAARNLAPHHQRKAIIAGSAAAIAQRALLTLFAVSLLDIPYLKLIGSVLLMWIGVKLLVAEDDSGEIKASASLWAAVRTILIADLVMSLDNVIAVAAAASSAPVNMRTPLLFIGLGLSIPLIVFGSTFLLKLMQRFPAIISLGAALLGFISGEMAITDVATRDWFEAHLHGMETPIGLACAALVVLSGRYLSKRQSATKAV